MSFISAFTVLHHQVVFGGRAGRSGVKGRTPDREVTASNRHGKDPGRSAQSAEGRSQLNTRTALTLRSQELSDCTEQGLVFVKLSEQRL